MKLFMLALVITAIGAGLYAFYDPGAVDVAVRSRRMVTVPGWQLVAGSAAVPLFLFLVHVLVAGFRVRRLRRHNERLMAELYSASTYAADRYAADQYAVDRYATEPAWLRPQPAPKRSWTAGE